MTSIQWIKRLNDAIRDGDSKLLKTVVMACNFYCNNHPDCQTITRTIQETVHDRMCPIPEGGSQCTCKEL